MHRTTILIIILSGVALLGSCTRSVEKDAMKRLADTIKDKDLYESVFLQRVNAKKEQYRLSSDSSTKWELAHQIYKEYLCYDLDSALVYCSLMEHLANSKENTTIALSNKATCYCALRLYPSVEKMLSEIDTTGFNERQRQAYYNAHISLYTALGNEFRTDKEMAERNKAQRHFYQNKLCSLKSISEEERKYLCGKQLMLEEKFDQALDTLHCVLKMQQDIASKLHTTYAIANCYNSKGDKVNYRRWLAETAIYDIKRPNKQYRSLYDLALQLHADGKNTLAGSFINMTVLDAISCKYDTRIINAVEAQMIIEAANHENASKKRWLLFYFCGLMGIVVIIVSLSLAKVNRQRKRLRLLIKKTKELNLELSGKNAIISEANLIKEKYMFKYMYLSANFIKEMDDYRKDLRQTYKSEGIDALMSKLREPEYIYMQYKAFYKLFDEIFLSIFPDFPSKVNSLLQEGRQINIKHKGSMPTELRILAVLRLGITESRKIAEFLNTSVNTVYTYRTKMRYDSIDGPEIFEEKIKNIDYFKI